MQGLGYKLYACLEGECSLDEAVRIIKKRYPALRQTAAYLVQTGTGCDLAG